MADLGFAGQDSFITMLTPAEPGDYNGDGFVDARDYSVWLSEFGTNNPSADGNEDGVVDASDYVTWQSHASGAGASASLPGSANVPEPSALLIAVNILLLGAARRRRLRQ